ncbi:MAG: uncharacterized protein JWP46_4033 [Modestobacter sp.]|jgi:hypothetical protein|nr:uncharacterized protein [Modestobacter sp.]
MKKLVVLLLVLVALAAVADRVGVRIAQRVVAQQIASRGGLNGAPDVQIAGIPFLTQAIGGQYDDVRVHLTAAELGQPAGTTADVSLRGVHLPLSDVLTGAVRQVPVDRVYGTAILPYALLSQQLGGDATVSAEGSGLRITRTVQVLGRDLPVTAAGSVSLDGQDLVVQVRQAEAVGGSAPAALLQRAAGLLDLRYRVPALPFGLQVTGLQPRPDGVHVEVAARNAVLAD